MQLTDNIQTLKNVGGQRAALLAKMDIHTIGDLVEYFPRDYLDRSRIYKIDQLQDGQMATIAAVLAGPPQTLNKGRINITKMTFGDGAGYVDLTWFNQPYMGRNFQKGTEYFISGRVVRKMGRLTIENPEWESVSDAALSAGRIVPIYSLTAGVSQKVLRGLMSQALDGLTEGIDDFLPPNILEAHGLCCRDFAVKNIHFPENSQAYYTARRRLVFEELFLMQGALMWAKGYFRQARGCVFEHLDAAEILAALPYQLTPDQQKVVGEISVDLSSGYAANRLIQGDVGSGKTAVAMIMCFLAVKNGTQAALMAPTETLATQHHISFAEIFGPLGVRCELLVGSLKAKDKTDVRRRLKNGEIDIIIGTHALIQSSVEFANLGLVITDEQHRFGVRQRGRLNEKGNHPHVLVMTATPIPRSLAMVLYGDMDISTINQLPPGRQKIDTYAVASSYHQRIFRFMFGEIEKGRQAYIICPLVEESEAEGFEDINSVTKFAEQLRNGVFADISLEILHGRMKPEEKNRIMASFAAGDTKILVSTTVIEVGINVPNATVILIENAERFGLSQLHQLRGRVGRSDKKSYCILVTDADNAVTKKRMEAMADTNDGFVLSELDLELRGPGEFFGTMQHGVPQMRLANLYKDMVALEEAKGAVLKVFEGDPQLLKTEHRGLKDRIAQILGRFGGGIGL
ncbi:MAG: ATP-dependent DNA helicase RecG [Defluviitaleaceae bacterium]|nr:ATP-dependent DNA helicase RecG [Defluviitaleaceae bacterium]